MKRLVLACIFLSVSGVVMAQKQSVTGTIRDTSANIAISEAAIAILSQKDSVLQTFTRSDKNGHFSLPDVPDGNYILLITYPQYGDFVEPFTVAAGNTVNLGSISLTQTAKLLDEIVIQSPAVLVKGDTTEYNADMYKVRENATAEDLLKELPGVQVNSDGTIIAQGQQVQKVLVDGDEFFSDDPTVATKNIRADAIAKVQVYDKKSDQAEFTGIDDGQEQKTIDLKLKESAKKGYFGKASVAGLDKYYNATGMINAFKAKRKLSAFAVGSTTDQTGLGFGDQNSLGIGGGGGGGRGGAGGFNSSSVSSGAGNFGGQGLPESVKAGFHYDDKWNEGKGSAGGDYLFNRLIVKSNQSTFSQNTLLDSVYYSRNTTDAHNNNLQHSVSGVMDIKIDSSSQITVRANGSTGTTSNLSQTTSEALDENMQTVNNSARTTTSSNDNNAFNVNAFYRKRFKKQGRTISINLNGNYNDSKGNQLLDDISNFFDTHGNNIEQQITDQNKTNRNKTQTLQTQINYTNPVSKNSYLVFNYSFNHNSNDQEKLSFNKDPNGKYDMLVDSLSSNFLYDYNTHSGGINYMVNLKKIMLNAGGSLSSTGVTQNDRLGHNSRDYNYTNLFPRATFQWRFNSFSSLRLNYNGNTTQPTIDQIQPLNDNSDPMNIVVGNPNLRQSFSNNISLNYNSFQMLDEKYLFVRFNFRTTSNQINSSYVIDSLGRRISKYINVNGNYSFSFSGNYSRKLSKTWRFNLSPNVSLSQNTNFINEIENATKSFTVMPGLSFNKRDVETYEFNLEYNPSYNSSKSSISNQASLNYWIQNINFDGRYTLPIKLDIGTNLDFEYRQKLDDGDNQNQATLWNVYLEKRFMKKEQLSLRFSIHDLLNQNKGYSRVINPNAIVESNYLTFRRYGLITLTYNFNTTGAGSPSSAPHRGGGGRFFR